MTLSESYPKEWRDIKTRRILQKKIDEYILKFVVRLLKEIKEGKRKEVDLGDGFSMGISEAERIGYKLSDEVHDFLMRLSSYGFQEVMGHGDTPYGETFENSEEVETELKKVAKKLNIFLK